MRAKVEKRHEEAAEREVNSGLRAASDYFGVDLTNLRRALLDPVRCYAQGCADAEAATVEAVARWLEAECRGAALSAADWARNGYQAESASAGAVNEKLAGLARAIRSGEWRQEGGSGGERR